MCVFCHSEQLFEREGKPLEYSFRVGDYLCLFPVGHPGPRFEIYKVQIDSGIPEPKAILQLDFIPNNIRPDNTTEERIKTLILFS